MSEETQKEVQDRKTERARVPNWMVNALLSAISAVSLWLVKDYIHQVDKLEKEKAEAQKEVKDCLDHRFNENIHRYDEAKKEISENRARIDSLIQVIQKGR